MKCCGISILIFLFFYSLTSFASNPSTSKTFAQNQGDTFGILLETANLWLGLPQERNAMILAKLPEGTKVKILDKKEQYYRVMHKTLIGYVDRQVIGLLGDNLKNFQPEPTTSEKKAPPVEAATANTSAVENTAYFIVKATSLRAFPNSKAQVYLRFAPDDMIVTVLDKSDRYWWQVEYQGRTGWVKCALLRKNP